MDHSHGISANILGHAIVLVKNQKWIWTLCGSQKSQPFFQTEKMYFDTSVLFTQCYLEQNIYWLSGNNLQKKIESTHFVSRAFRDFAQKRQWIHVNNAQCISFFVEHFAATFVCIIHKNCEFVHKINCDWWVGKSTNNSRLHHGIFSALKHWNLRQTWFEFHNFCEIFLLFPPIFFLKKMEKLPINCYHIIIIRIFVTLK